VTRKFSIDPGGDVDIASFSFVAPSSRLSKYMALRERGSATTRSETSGVLQLSGEGFRVATLFCRGRGDGQSVSIAVLH
jgi:hypothetical protein